jgi:alkylation response protein AidB-like acyl-CoA dehydrogenase
VTTDFREEARASLLAAVSAIGWDARTGDPKDLDAQHRFHRELAARGMVGLAWPREYGGGGRTLEEQVIFAEESAKLRAPEAYNRVALGIAGPAIMLFGDESQRARYLPPILSGDEVWCQGFSEPGAGSDLASLRTGAGLGDDGSWHIRGQKVWTTLASVADMCLLLARTSEDRHQGITAFLVPMRQTGVQVRPIRQINGEEDFSEVFFDDVVVDAEAVLGDVGAGWRTAMGALAYERSVHLVQRQVRLDEMVDATIRSSFDSPSGALFREPVFELQVAAMAMKHAVRQQLRSIDSGEQPGVEANATKVLWSETYQKLTRTAVDIAAATPGARDLERWLREYYSSLATSIYAGTNEVQRNIIAERGLGLPR